VMTVAAQLMSAGADQQLIATELQTSVAVEEIPEKEEPKEDINEIADDGSLGNISIHKDEIKIDHDETLAELDARVRTEHEEPEAVEVKEEEPEFVPVQEPVAELEPEQPETVEEPVSVYAAAEPTPEPVTVPQLPVIPEREIPAADTVANVYTLEDDEIEPSLGGTLNATSEQAAEDKRREAMSDQNRTILSHAYAGDELNQTSNPLETNPVGFPGTPSVAPGSQGVNEVDEDEGVHSAYALADVPAVTPTAAPTFGIGGEKVIEPLPVTPPAPAPVDLGLPLPPPLPDFSQGPLAPPVFPSAPAPVFSPEPVTQPEILGDILAPETPAPNSAYAFEPIETPITSAPPSPNDPGQFKIPS